jgi:cyclic pyranopterin phosphate synthase
MPKEVFGSRYEFLRRSQLLSFEEIERVARLLSVCGVKKIRLTGGEPLVRRDLERLVGMLASIPGIEDLSLTTNGALLTRKKAQALREAGLQRVTISLDSLDDEAFKAMNDVGFPVQKVLAAIENAYVCGLKPVKVNMVVKRGVNDQSVTSMARHFHGSGHIVRFIEYMDVGTTNGWRLDDVVPAAEIVNLVSREFELEPASPNYAGEVAKRWRYKDGGGEIGVIASVTQPFCASCSRARLSADGSLYTCLFASSGQNLRRLLREGASDEYIKTALVSNWNRRDDQYSLKRTTETTAIPKVEMSYIGG